MIFPYITPNIIQTDINSYTYNLDGQCDKHIHRLLESHRYMECLKDDCAVWRNGQCTYNGGT